MASRIRAQLRTNRRVVVVYRSSVDCDASCLFRFFLRKLISLLIGFQKRFASTQLWNEYEIRAFFLSRDVWFLVFVLTNRKKQIDLDENELNDAVQLIAEAIRKDNSMQTHKQTHKQTNTQALFFQTQPQSSMRRSYRAEAAPLCALRIVHLMRTRCTAASGDAFVSMFNSNYQGTAASLGVLRRSALRSADVD